MKEKDCNDCIYEVFCDWPEKPDGCTALTDENGWICLE